MPSWLSNGDTDSASSVNDTGAAIASGDSGPSDRAITVWPARWAARAASSSHDS